MPRISTILGALEAVKNIRAFILTALVLITAVFVVGLFSYMGVRGGSFALGAVGALLAGLIALYGSSAVGFMLMNDARGASSLTIGEALTISLLSTHRWIAVMLLAALVFVLFVLATLLILFVCKIPVLGPLLYTVVLPVTTLATAAFLAAMWFVVIPLAFPAVWTGDTTMQVLSKLTAIGRQRLFQVVALTLLLALLCFIAGMIIGVFAFGGLAIVGALSATVLPNVGAGFGGLYGVMSSLMLGGGYEGAGYIVAGGIGAAIVLAFVMIVPFLILFQGYCLIYLDVIQGIDLSAAEEQLTSRMENIQRKAREAQERVREKTQPLPAKLAAPLVQTQPFPPAPAAAAALTATQMPSAGRCPKCSIGITGEDVFCGGCGFRLR